MVTVGEQRVRLDRYGMELLSREGCLDLLSGASVGRIAVSMNALPAIFPVNFAMLEGDVVFRTGTGMKLGAAVTNSIVAFEVDEFDHQLHHGWSVLVVGRASEILSEPDLVAAEHLGLRPWAVGVRETRFIRIDTEIISGRRIVDD